MLLRKNVIFFIGVVKEYFSVFVYSLLMMFYIKLLRKVRLKLRINRFRIVNVM